MRQGTLPLGVPQAPLRFNVSENELLNEANALNKELSETINAIVLAAKTGPMNFERCLVPFVHYENKRWARGRFIKFHASTSTTPSLRDESDRATKLLEEYDIEVFQNVDFGAVVATVWKSREDLDPRDRRYVEKLHDGFEQGGLTIDDASKRAKYQAIAKRLKDLQREAIRNLNSDTSGHFFSRNELEGLPTNILNRLKQTVDTEGETKYWVTSKDPDVAAVRTHVVNAATRRLVGRTAANRCPRNIPIHREVFLLRDEAARIMGFENHAEFRMRHKMLGNIGTVTSMLHQIGEQFRVKRDSELKKIQQMKEVDIGIQEPGPEPVSINIADTAFYGRIIKENTFSYNELEVAEYFTLDRTLERLLGIFEHLFGIEIVQLQSEDRWIWHPSVLMYAIWDQDQSNDFMGYLYLDPFPRDGKYTHFGHFALSPGYSDNEGKRHYPCAAIVMNLPPPTEEKPSLLSHSELRRVFHEIGHGMHNLLSRTRYARFHGTNVDTDFVEAPSMMFEHFLWKSEYMRDISYHYSRLNSRYQATWENEQRAIGAPVEPKQVQIPQSLVDNLVASKHVNGALSQMARAWKGMYDIQVHSPTSHQEIESMDLSHVWYSLRSKFMGYDDFDSEDKGTMGHGWSSFRALMGKYDVGYYAYSLAQVYSCDLFYTGFGNDAMNPERGRRYRYIVLEPGSSRSEMDTLREFLGRDPNTDAFCEEHGIRL